MKIEAAWLKEIRETLASRRVWAFVLLVAVVPLVLPSAVVHWLGVTHLRDQLRPYLVAAAVIALAGLVVAEVTSLDSWWDRKQRARLQFKYLRSLSPAEKRVLRGYIEGNTKTQYFRMDDGVVGGLVKPLGYLYVGAEIGYMEKGFAFNIQPWLWDYLVKHPEILGKAEDDPPDVVAREPLPVRRQRV